MGKKKKKEKEKKLRGAGQNKMLIEEVIIINGEKNQSHKGGCERDSNEKLGKLTPSECLHGE